MLHPGFLVHLPRVTRCAITRPCVTGGIKPRRLVLTMQSPDEGPEMKALRKCPGLVLPERTRSTVGGGP